MLNELCVNLQYLFKLYFERSILLDDLKIAKVTPVFKTGNNNTEHCSFRPISVRPCFSKILERIMYNCLYKYLLDSNILYKKQFGFQKEYSRNHTIAQLIYHIQNNFEENNFTLVFIDLSKAFDTVDLNILLKN